MTCAGEGCDRTKTMGRGLCQRCYSRAKRDGTLDLYARRQKRSSVVVEEYEFFRGFGYSDDVIAERLGMTRGALANTLKRAMEGAA